MIGMEMRLHYDGAPRAITEEEARRIARDEWTMRSSYGKHTVMSRGADGGFHERQSFGRSQAAVVYMITRRRELTDRIMTGKCEHTVFYDRARDTFYCG